MKKSVKQASKPVARPFGLELLETVSETVLEDVSGGLRFHTDFVSLDSPAFPQGDRG